MTTIDSQYLRVFCALARHLSMSRAAQELDLTPSAVSHCLKALETDLGCRLFERTPRKLALTQAGVEFVTEAEAILQRMNSARGKLRNWMDWRRGRLRIAASTTACQYILPQALREFRESFPSFTIQIDPCPVRQALEAIGGGEMDLGFFVEPAQHTGMNFIVTGQDELQYLVNPVHSWARNKRASRDDVSSQNLILPERGSDGHTLIENYFRRSGIRIQPFIEIDNEEAIKQFVRLDLGIGMLLRWIAAAEISQGSLLSLPLGRRRLRRNWGIFHARGHKLSFAENVFIDLCRSVSHNLMTESAN